MAFENMTYEQILERILNRISTNYPNIDIREGSMIYNAVAPCALELAIAYTELDNVLNESFVGTASREFLFKKCEEQGIDTSQFQATNGKFKGEFNVQVEIGSRWNLDLYNYKVIKFLEKTEESYFIYELECETQGAAPNDVYGTLTPIDNAPSGLNHAELTETIIAGENEATDDDIRNYYFNYVNSDASNGNVRQYELWCEEYQGIGNFKITPLWNGANTVKVSILGADNKAASEELIKEFQTYLDPNTTGMGDGVAPIGALVTVDTGTELPISVAANIILKEGFIEDAAKEELDAALVDYFASIAYEKAQVNYMSVGATLLDCSSVSAISNLKVNGGAVDIPLSDNQIPTLGTTTWTVTK